MPKGDWFKTDVAKRMVAERNRLRKKPKPLKKKQKTPVECFKELVELLPQLDFSEFVYKNAKTKSKVICPKHGKFEINANDLKSGHGCRLCAVEKNLSKRIEEGKCRHPNDIPEYEKYRREVWRESNLVYSHYADELGVRDRHNHLDHIFSILDGWINKVDPKVLGSRINLRVISGMSNRKKNSKSDITLDELYSQYEAKHHEEQVE
jgi:hypothetical protein